MACLKTNYFIYKTGLESISYGYFGFQYALKKYLLFTITFRDECYIYEQ
jgi:hypothetical protein